MPADSGTARPGSFPARVGTVPDLAANLAALLPAARAARDELHQDGHPLTRDNLATRLRQAGHPGPQRQAHSTAPRTPDPRQLARR